MSTSQRYPDYALDDLLVVSQPQQVKAMFDPLRATLLELLLERAASVQELAAAVQRPKSSVAYHVGVLHDAGLLTVVRTRRVRGREERFYGRTARLFGVGDVHVETDPARPGFFEAARQDAARALEADRFRGLTRYAWIPEQMADAFWERVLALMDEFVQLPRTPGDTHAFALLSAIYPTEHARLPEAEQTTAD